MYGRGVGGTREQMRFENPSRMDNFYFGAICSVIVVILSILLIQPTALFDILFISFVIAAVIYIDSNIFLREIKRPRFVTVLGEGLLFEYKDGSKSVVQWGEIKDIAPTPKDFRERRRGQVVLSGTRRPIPIPYEAYEEALIARKLRKPP